MPRATGPKKVRIPGSNTWVVEGSPEALELRDAQRAAAAAAVVDEGDEVDEYDLGPLPERPVRAPEPQESFPHYYHPYYRNIRVRPGRKDALKWINGIIYPK